MNAPGAGLLLALSGDDADILLNHSRDPELIAINLNHFAQIRRSNSKMG